MDNNELINKLLEIENMIKSLRMSLSPQTDLSNFNDELPARRMTYNEPETDEFDEYVRQLNGQSTSSPVNSNSGAFSNQAVRPTFNFNDRVGMNESMSATSLPESLLTSLADICKEECQLDGSFNDIVKSQM